MDIANLTQSVSVAPSPVKAAGTTVAKKPAATGNSLPAAGQVSAQSVTPQAENQQAVSSPTKLNIADLNNLVDEANKVLQGRFSDLKFTVAEGTDINVVRIEDSETGELIRQFPSEAMIAIARAIGEMQQGMMLEEKA